MTKQNDVKLSSERKTNDLWANAGRAQQSTVHVQELEALREYTVPST